MSRIAIPGDGSSAVRMAPLSDFVMYTVRFSGPLPPVRRMNTRRSAPVRSGWECRLPLLVASLTRACEAAARDFAGYHGGEGG
jgi:hypothetical protein